VLGVDPEAAVVLLHDLGGAVELGGPRPGLERDRQRLAGRRAGERHQEQQRGVRVVLRVRGVLEAEHVARVLEHHVLEAAARSEGRHAALAAVAQRAQRAAEASVRAAGRAQQRVGGVEVADRVGRVPAHVGLDAQLGRRVAQRVVGGDVRRERRVELADHRDVEMRGHGRHDAAPAPHAPMPLCVGGMRDRSWPLALGR
jgi:hypothetical protein